MSSLLEKLKAQRAGTRGLAAVGAEPVAPVQLAVTDPHPNRAGEVTTLEPGSVTLERFLSDVLPRRGDYVAATPTAKAWEHRSAQSIPDLVAVIEGLGDRPNIYFAVSSFKVGSVTRYAGRSQDNVSALRCFRLDLDAGDEKLRKHGPEKVYRDRAAALEAFERFTTAAGVTPSYTVSSGEGLHVYYVLDDDVTPDQWRPVAKALQRFGTAHGLKIDSSVTADHARVLRPIGTRHPNGKRVGVIAATGKVYTLAQFAELVEAEAPDHEGLPPYGSGYDLSVNADILPWRDTRPADFERVKAGCEAIRWAADPANQAEVEEPYWRLVFGVIAHCDNAEEHAREASRHHPEYGERATLRKLNGWRTPPTKCETIAGVNADACTRCPHRGRITSPIRLGKPEDTTPPGADAANDENAVPEWVREINERHAVVRMGRDAVIADNRTPDPTARGIVYGLGWLSAATFRQLYKGRFVEVKQGDGSTKRVPLPEAWLSDVRRRQFEAAVFAPGEALPPTILNLYQGFAVVPTAGDVSPWLQLLEALVTDPDERGYVMRWIAWKVQNPGGVPDTILIFLGLKGTGKNSLFDPILFIFGRHAMLADDPELIAGRFTWHLMALCFAVLDEAVFIGDPRQQDRIKSRVTARTMLYEQKGMDPVSGVNRCAYVMLTNHAHAWQATTDERRAVVIETGEGLRGRLDFWERYHAWSQGEGPSALLHYLQRIDLSGFNPRRIPKGEALRRQVEQTALRDPAVAWWHQCLTEGAIRWRDGGIEREVVLHEDQPTEADVSAVRESYQQSAGARGRNGMGWAQVAKRLHVWCGPDGLHKARPRAEAGARLSRYTVPALPALRQHFMGATGVQIDH